MITRPALRWTRPSPRTTAGAVTTTVHHTTGSPIAIGEVPRPPALSGRPRPSPHAPATQRRHRNGHHHRPGSPSIHPGDLHPGNRGPGRDRVRSTRRLQGRRSALTPGLLPGASTHSRHATPNAPDHGAPPTSPTSPNVTADEQPRTEAGTTHLPGIATGAHSRSTSSASVHFSFGSPVATTASSAATRLLPELRSNPQRRRRRDAGRRSGPPTASALVNVAHK